MVYVGVRVVLVNIDYSLPPATLQKVDVEIT
jgi:hypothetical protein